MPRKQLPRYLTGEDPGLTGEEMLRRSMRHPGDGASRGAIKQAIRRALALARKKGLSLQPHHVEEIKGTRFLRSEVEAFARATITAIPQAA